MLAYLLGLFVPWRLLAVLGNSLEVFLFSILRIWYDSFDLLIMKCFLKIHGLEDYFVNSYDQNFLQESFFFISKVKCILIVAFFFFLQEFYLVPSWYLDCFLSQNLPGGWWASQVDFLFDNFMMHTYILFMSFSQTKSRRKWVWRKNLKHPCKFFGDLMLISLPKWMKSR